MHNFLYISFSKYRKSSYAFFIVPLFIFSLIKYSTLQAQTCIVKGLVKDEVSILPFAKIKYLDQNILTDSLGYFTLKLPNCNSLKLYISYENHISDSVFINPIYQSTIEIILLSEYELASTEITAESYQYYGIERLKSIDGLAIYEGKKNEIIKISDLNVNQATNNSRQIFAKVPGINIIENDGSGIQLGIAVRGLNPNRISEFNSRQNGYDISADALGYPESYYTPPTQALERIEVVRGAASLQYGSQFGGLLNFVLRKGPFDKKFEYKTQQTGGSFGFFSSFHSIGGTVKKLNYYAYGLYKRSDSWRQNSGFQQGVGYANVNYNISQKAKLSFDLTYMRYVMQQPGGLTDKQFAIDPRASNRERNWFSANWLLPALNFQFNFTEKTKLNLKTFALIADRSSIGNLIAPSQSDYRLSRNLMVDNYLNVGMEFRFLHEYNIKKIKGAFLTGIRYYHGNTHRMQGLGTEGSDANFNFVNPNNLEAFDYRFPSTNVAIFAENIFYLTPKLTMTPGFRWEYIQTQAVGYYKVDEVRYEDKLNKPRNFPLFGIGFSYHLTTLSNLYFNFSQNYAGVNFNDLRVANPNFKVDPNLKDVSGYNADLGFRGNWKNRVNFDVGVFYLGYKDRIGVINMSDANFNVYRFRTNVADSRSFGTETFVELNIFEWFKFNSGIDYRLYLLSCLSGRFYFDRFSAGR